MALIVAARVWHYWIGIAILIPSVLMVLATVVGYLTKVTSNRYPKR